MFLYQVATKYIGIPNISKNDQMAIKYTNIFHCKTPPKFAQNWIFGLKTNHLATLIKHPAAFLMNAAA
jgi:hypothetical protein